MIRGTAKWTYDGEADAWYFALDERQAPPYLTQRRIEAIVDIAADGTLAGIEILVPMPPPPSPPMQEVAS